MATPVVPVEAGGVCTLRTDCKIATSCCQGFSLTAGTTSTPNVQSTLLKVCWLPGAMTSVA